ncbi:MAG: hypothetical protein Q8O86_04720 [Dehalococcoidia bacterium]|nr:hypothetical protein [Dehalococcoidia bacterium]
MEQVPDVYADQFTLGLSAYGVALTFSLNPSTPSPIPSQQHAEPQAVIRMSLEHAKVMIMLLKKNLKQFELEHLGDPIKLPKRLLQELNLDEADW